MKVELQSCKASSADWLDAFYQETGYSYPVPNQDDIFYAEVEGQKIGVVRISNEYGCSVLRGMQVLEPFRGQGVGTKLLTFLASTLRPDPVYCIPNDHLVNFYGKIGFSVIDSDEAPEFLVERLNDYIESNFKVLIMVRKMPHNIQINPESD